MRTESTSLDQRVEQLAAEVRALSARVDDLSARMAGGGAGDAPGIAAASAVEGEFDKAMKGDWSGATLLAGLAEVCFLLVVALVLRTLVDNRIIDQPIGSLAGLVYAALVTVYGYFRARAKRRYATLTSLCGAALVLAIVLETHFRFGLLPADGAYAILAVSILVMTAGAIGFGAYFPIAIAMPFLVLAAMALQFPDPDFAYLGGVIVVAVIAAYLVTDDPRARWLVWCMLAMSTFFWLWWGLKLSIPLSRHDELPPTIRDPFFLPCAAIFAGLYAAQTFWSALSAKRPVGAFECAAPLLGGAVTYATARLVIVAGGSSAQTLGFAGIGAAALLLLAAGRFAGRGEAPRRAATWLAVASLLLSLFIAHDVSSNTLGALALLTAIAIAVGAFGEARLGLAVQFAAFLVHAAACAAGAWQGAYRVLTVSPTFAVPALAALALAAMYHQTRLRRVALADGATARPVQRALAVASLAVFWVSVVYAFGAGRIALFHGLAALGEGALYAFECGQSILINAGALLLAVVAVNRRRQDLLATALLVAAVGALKVFAWDLLRTQGVPLVLDVLAFGLTATAGSLIWGRWQRATTPDETAPKASDS